MWRHLVCLGLALIGLGAPACGDEDIDDTDGSVDTGTNIDSDTDLGSDTDDSGTSGALLRYVTRPPIAHHSLSRA
ncbi:MAG: hypothetical protein ACJAZO_004655 [Myxococcota bacterium]